MRSCCEVPRPILLRLGAITGLPARLPPFLAVRRALVRPPGSGYRSALPGPRWRNWQTQATQNQPKAVTATKTHRQLPRISRSRSARSWLLSARVGGCSRTEHGQPRSDPAGGSTISGPRGDAVLGGNRPSCEPPIPARRSVEPERQRKEEQRKKG